MNNIERLTSGYMSRGWTHGCKAVRKQKHHIEQYLGYWGTREQWTQDRDRGRNKSRTSELFATEVFSFFNMTHSCRLNNNNNDPPQIFHSVVPIEPLMGALRHPLFHCRDMPKSPLRPGYFHDAYRVNKDYMLPIFKHEFWPIQDPEAVDGRLSQAFLFDLGASLYADGFGGGESESESESEAMSKSCVSHVMYSCLLRHLACCLPQPAPLRYILSSLTVFTDCVHFSHAAHHSLCEDTHTLMK